MVEIEINGFVPGLLRHVYLTHLLSAALRVRNVVLDIVFSCFQLGSTRKTLTLFCEEKDSQATGRAYETTCAMLSHECGGKLQDEGSPRLMNPRQVPEPLFSMMILFLCRALALRHCMTL